MILLGRIGEIQIIGYVTRVVGGIKMMVNVLSNNKMNWQVLVCRNGSVDKFWAYHLGDEGFEHWDPTSEIPVRFGRVGTVGQEVKYHANDLVKKIREKFKKNYRNATEDELAQFFGKEVVMLWEI